MAISTECVNLYQHIFYTSCHGQYTTLSDPSLIRYHVNIKPFYVHSMVHTPKSFIIDVTLCVGHLNMYHI